MIEDGEDFDEARGASERYADEHGAEILVDGEPDRGRFWHTDLWVRNDHGWQALWSQATRIPG